MKTIAIGQPRENDCFSCSRKSKGGPNPPPQWRRRFAKCRKCSAPSSPNLVRAKSCAAIARACDAEIAEMIYDIIPPKKGRAVLVRARIQAPGGEARRGGGLGQMIRTHSLKRERWGEKWAAQRKGRPKA